MKDLTVFVLTHNRGELLLETIDSVLKQTCHDFKFIVSDNSSNDETMKMLEEKKYLDKFEYRKRDREYSSFEHFNLCLKEVNTKYFVLFHDDDIMLDDYVETMYNEIKNSNYVAVGCNAKKLFDKNKKKYICSVKNNKILYNKNKLIKYYLTCNIVPFPSYIYCKDKIQNHYFSNEIGKYSDVKWLIDISNEGPLKWLSRSLMLYRFHTNQDSTFFDVLNQFKLAKYFLKNGLSFNLYNLYRCRIIYIYTSIKKKNYPLKIFKKYAFLQIYLKALIKKSFIYTIIKRG